MRYGISQSIRNIVVHLDRGEELLDSLRKLCAEASILTCSFSGTGIFETASFSVLGRDGESEVLTLDHPVALSVRGNVCHFGDDLVVCAYGEVQSWRTPKNGTEMASILSGKVSVLELFVTAYDNLVMRDGKEIRDLSTHKEQMSSTEGKTVTRRVVSVAEEFSKSNLKSHDNDQIKDGNVNGSVHFEEKSAFSESSLKSKASEDDPLDVWRRVAAQAAQGSVQSESPKSKETTQEVWKRAAASARAEISHAEKGVSLANRQGQVGVHVVPVGGRDKFYNPMQASEVSRRPKVLLGDMLLHPSLGDCIVARVDDEETVYIRTLQLGGASSRFKRITLKLFDITPVDVTNDRTVYRLTKKI